MNGEEPNARSEDVISHVDCETRGREFATLAPAECTDAARPEANKSRHEPVLGSKGSSKERATTGTLNGFSIYRLFNTRAHERSAQSVSSTGLATGAEKRAYILRVCRALMMYGAPAHRLEGYMRLTAETLGIHLQAFHLPGFMIISFDDDDRLSVDVQVITAQQSLDLSKLLDAHSIYKDVIHRRQNVQNATTSLDRLIARDATYPRWLRILMYGLASACIGPVSYGARPVDLPLIFVLGSITGLLELVVAARSELYGYVFEMTAAIGASFIARGIGSITWGDGRNFCFSAIAQASLVLILPGFTVTSSALELQSKMMITGASRLIYGVIYTLFLAFGYLIGITVYGAIDSGATSATTCKNSWPWWWGIAFVLPFTFCYVIVNQAKWRQIPAMLIVTLAGWVVNHFSATKFSAVQSIPNALGALTVGILSNLYSRLGHGLAVTVMHPAIFILVPGSFAASGSLIGGLTSANELTHNPGSIAYAPGKSSALQAAYTMVEIAVGMTAGLSISTLLVYPIRNKRGKGGLFSY